jgi:hypothetical protein
MRGDGFQSPQCAYFYVFPVVSFQQIRSVNVIHRLPCIVTLGLSSPLDKILQGVTAPKVSMITDGFDLILSFSFD